MLSVSRNPTPAVAGLPGKVKRCDHLDVTLKSYAQLASAAAIGCRWYLDLDYFLSHNEGLDIAKVREVPRWRESEVFTDLERDVMEYAEAMSTAPATATDWMVDKLVDQLGRSVVLELTQVVALENMRARFSWAAGLQGQGRADAC